MGMKAGKVPENVLKRSVLRQIQTRRSEIVSGAGIGEDCAVFSFGGAPVMTCVQTAAVRLSAAGGYGAVTAESPARRTEIPIGQLIQRCANNLAAAGAQPVGVMIGLMLPEEAEEPDIRALMGEAEARCGELNIQIAGGQTFVSPAVRQPTAAVTGYGKPFTADSEGEKKGIVPGSPERMTSKKLCVGQDVVVSKWIGLEGTAILAGRCREELLRRYPAYLVEEAAGFDRWLSVIPEAATAMKSGVCMMHDASEGGIFGALWELAEKAGVGLTIDLKKLPLRQETVEVCECCNVNPYELLSGGALVMVTADGPGLVAALEAEKIPAVIVGKVTGSNDRLLVNGEEVRFLDRPKSDGIYRENIAQSAEMRRRR